MIITWVSKTFLTWTSHWKKRAAESFRQSCTTWWWSGLRGMIKMMEQTMVMTNKIVERLTMVKPWKIIHCWAASAGSHAAAQTIQNWQKCGEMNAQRALNYFTFHLLSKNSHKGMPQIYTCQKLIFWWWWWLYYYDHRMMMTMMTLIMCSDSSSCLRPPWLIRAGQVCTSKMITWPWFWSFWSSHEYVVNMMINIKIYMTSTLMNNDDSDLPTDCADLDQGQLTLWPQVDPLSIKTNLHGGWRRLWWWCCKLTDRLSRS